MSTDKILQKIRQEAEAEAAAIIEAGKEKAGKAAGVILEAAREQANEAEKSASFETDEIERRGKLVANLDARKNTLRRKREVLDEAFVLALKRLESLPEDRYEALILAVVTEAAETGTETICVAKADMPKFQNGLMNKLNSRLITSGNKGELKLSPTPANIKGGVIIVGEKADVNASFEALVRYEREGCEKEVADILFGSEVG